MFVLMYYSVHAPTAQLRRMQLPTMYDIVPKIIKPATEHTKGANATRPACASFCFSLSLACLCIVLSFFLSFYLSFSLSLSLSLWQTVNLDDMFILRRQVPTLSCSPKSPLTCSCLTGGEATIGEHPFHDISSGERTARRLVGPRPA